MLRRVWYIYLLVGGCSLVLLSGFFTFRYVNTAEQRLEEAVRVRAQLPARATAVVLVRNVEPGAILQDADLQHVDLYSDHLHDRMIRNLDDLSDDSDRPLMALRALKAGDLVLWSDVVRAGQIVTQDVPLPLGNAAIVIEVTNEDIASFQVGAVVDVSGATKQSGRPSMTRTLAKDLILISAIDLGDEGRAQVVLLGPQELIDTLGGLYAGNDLRLTQERRTLLSAGSTQSEQEPVIQQTERSQAETGQRGSGNVLGSLERYVSTVVPNEQEQTCSLTVVRSAQRTQIEVPCR
ncbi:hypothetical protein ACLGGT_21130 [Roseovarius sp. MS2]|uniref:hypothetical protein n=1 Tax=Roseovarius sp. MS2 TaxID=3390728 RepID=UPI003EDBDAC0